jgi:hypothetical protein
LLLEGSEAGRGLVTPAMKRSASEEQAGAQPPRNAWLDFSQAPGPAEVIQQRSMGLDDAAAVRALWRRQRALEAVLEDDQESEPVQAEALRELEEVTEFLRKSLWRSRGGAERCVRAVTMAIRRFYSHLAGAVDAQGGSHPVLQAFGRHLREHLMTPSGRGGDHRKARALSPFAGCYTYEPPPGVVWAGKKGLLPK